MYVNISTDKKSNTSENIKNYPSNYYNPVKWGLEQHTHVYPCYDAVHNQPD